MPRAPKHIEEEGDRQEEGERLTPQQPNVRSLLTTCPPAPSAPPPPPVRLVVRNGQCEDGMASPLSETPPSLSCRLSVVAGTFLTAILPPANSYFKNCQLDILHHYFSRLLKVMTEGEGSL